MPGYSYDQIRQFLKHQQSIRRAFVENAIDAWERDMRIRQLKEQHVGIEESPDWDAAVRDHVLRLLAMQRGMRSREVTSF